MARRRQQQQQVEQGISLAPGVEVPCRYRQLPHPTVPFTSFCTDCELGKKQEVRNTREDLPSNSPVNGSGPDDLSNVKLIVISDHPGAYESAPSRAYPMFDNRLRADPDDPDPIPQRPNAGALLRMALEEMFGICSYTEVWTTNAVRCNPQEISIQEKHVKACVNSWLRSEIQIVSRSAGLVPILAAGSQAFRAIKYLFPEDFKHLPSQNECRRRSDLRVGGHPLVVTANPAVAARAEQLVETVVRAGMRIMEAEPIGQPIFGSPQWHFANDLLTLGEFL